MPKSRSPQGIQFASPLQRQWMIRSSIGRLALKAATVFGASSSSQRATKRMPAATISNTRETLPAPGREAKPESDEHDPGDDVDRAPYAARAQHRAHPGDERQPSERQRRECESVKCQRRERHAELRQQAREEHRHLRIREVAEQALAERRSL